MSQFRLNTIHGMLPFSLTGTADGFDTFPIEIINDNHLAIGLDPCRSVSWHILLRIVSALHKTNHISRLLSHTEIRLICSIRATLALQPHGKNRHENAYHYCGSPPYLLTAEPCLLICCENGCQDLDPWFCRGQDLNI